MGRYQVIIRCKGKKAHTLRTDAKNKKDAEHQGKDLAKFVLKFPVRKCQISTKRI